jgi:hypothetical protein
MPRRVLASLVCLLSLSSVSYSSKPERSSEDSIPLGNFVQLMADLSEPEGYFDSDNFVSNERAYLKVLSDLKRNGIHGGAYLGVGPDQNYSYIAHIRPRLAIIIDIRRQNALQHLYFKSLFERSSNRMRYLERLFGKSIARSVPAPEALGISELLHFIDQASSNQAFEDRKLEEAIQVLQSWNPGLSKGDYDAIRLIAQAFMVYGPDLKFSSYNRAPRAQYPSYRQLLEETDSEGIQSNYLATEEDFQFIKKLHHENRIVPIVGDLAGSSAILQTAEELRRRKLELTCFYVSNVEYYLFGGERWPAYVRNLSRLPRAANAYLIRSYADTMQPYSAQFPGYYMRTILQSLQVFLTDESAGKHKNYWDLLAGVGLR